MKPEVVDHKPIHDYPGMETVEEEKLSWTGDLPAVSSATELSNISARFALDGSLLPHDVDVPVQVLITFLSNS